MTVRELKLILAKIDNQAAEVKIWDRIKIDYAPIFSVNPCPSSNEVFIEGEF